MTQTVKYDLKQSTLAACAIIGPTLGWVRASDATRFDSAGDLQTAGSNVDRLASHMDEGAGFVNKGGWIELSATNEQLNNRDWTDAAYSASNVTAAKDATGIDGSANSASTLTADAANGTIRQAITLGSAERTSSCYVKRKTGTGTIEFTDNGGTNYTDITSSLATDSWYRVAIQRTQANPDVGFRIVTSGDEIEVDYGQVETDSFASSPIATTATAATRAADEVTTTTMTWMASGGAGTYVIRTSKPHDDAAACWTFSVSDGGSSDRISAGYFGGSGFVAICEIYSTSTAYVGNYAINAASSINANDVLGMSVDTDDWAGSFNGGTEETDTSVTLPVGLSELNIGSGHATHGQCSSFVETFEYWDTADEIDIENPPAFETDTQVDVPQDSQVITDNAPTITARAVEQRNFRFRDLPGSKGPRF